MAASLLIEPGRWFRYDGQAIVFRKRARDAAATHIFERPDGVPVVLSSEDLRTARYENRLVDHIDANLAAGEANKATRARTTMDSADPKTLDEADRWLDYIQEWQLTQLPRSERYLGPLIQTVHARRIAELAKLGRTEAPVSASQLKRRIADYLACGKNPDAVVNQHRRKGNRRPRLTQTIRSIIAEQIDEKYLVKNGCGVAALHRAISEAVRATNKQLPAEAQQNEPSYDATSDAVARLCPFTVDYHREGPLVARERWRGIGSGIVTTHANEVWEIDDTKIDLICLAEDGVTVIGRPWLTAVIDRHTRMIMAFVLSFTPPDTHTAMEVMRRAMLPKEEWLSNYPNIKSHWPAEGGPIAVHVDNGKHYNSYAFKRALTQLGIAHRAMPVLRAWYKGVVERLFGTIARQVFHIVPGTTYANIFDRDKEQPPEEVAVATVVEIDAKLLEWVVEDYQFRHHKGIDMAPNRLWHQSAREHPFPLPRTRADIERALSLVTARTLRKDGLEYFGLLYTSEHVVRLRMVPRHDRVREVVIRINRENLEAIEFLDTVTDVNEEHWRPAYVKRSQLRQVEGRSLEEYLLARALRNANPEEYGDRDPDFERTYEKLDENRRKATASDRLADRARAEAERERLLKDARRNSDPRANPAVVPDPGQDLQSLIDAELPQQIVARADSAASASVPAPAEFPAQQRTLTSTTRRKRKE